MNTRYWLILPLMFLALSWGERAEAATYQCVLNAQQDAILAEEIAFRNLALTPQQSIQRLCNRELTQLGQEQQARTVQDFNAMVKITTPAAQDNAEAALAAGIMPPTIADIPNQTSNVGQAVTVPIVATNNYPNDMALTFRVTGLPPGIAFGSDATGAPQLSGKPTTAGSYAVTIDVFNVSQVKATETFTWTVNL